ncbi:MAG: hypothetical protein H6810_03970 [Phycisphaeraceae bacterium]|nr:MAG: hypothetical protein H6810_03970 [Phycisphaeraceae bacterium]
MLGKTEPNACECCGYSLERLGHDAICPECGSTLKTRGEIWHRRWWTGQTVALYLLSQLPSAAFFVVSLAGWVIAHVALEIPRRTPIDPGGHPVLDLLEKGLALCLLGSLGSVFGLLVLLPVFVYWRIRIGLRGDRRFWALLTCLVAAGIPTLLLPLLFAPGRPLVWMFDWRPR